MSNFRLFLLAIAASGLFALAPAATEAQTGAISGVVTDAVTGDPLAGAAATAHITGVWGWDFDFTNSDGEYLIDDLEPGSYEVIVRRYGYVMETATVRVSDGVTTTADFALEEPAFGTVTGTITDAGSGDPIAGARVVIGSWRHSAITDADGNYTIEDVLSGERRVLVRKSGYYTDVSTVEVLDTGTTTHDVALDPLAYGTISGVITDASTGAPIAGARVQVGWAWWSAARTNDAGEYTIEDVLAGDRTVYVLKWGYYGDTSTVTVADGATTTHDVALEPLSFGSVTGVVTDSATGDPIEGAWVQAGWAWWNGAATDADGEYSIDDLLAGDYTLYASKTGYYLGEAAATVTGGATTTADVALDPIEYGSISGVVTNSETGSPVSGARVQVGWDFWGAVYTNSAGEYTVEDVVAGDQTVYVSKFFYFTDVTEVEVVAGETATHDVSLAPF